MRGAFIDRALSEGTTLKSAMKRYLAEVSPTKSAETQRRETVRAKALLEKLGDYALVAVTPELVAKYRDNRLDARKSGNTVRLELALLSHLFTVAIQEWGMGLVYNPVSAVRKPSAGSGHNRRLNADEERALLAACDKAANPMLGRMVRLAIYTGMRAGEIQTLRRKQVDVTKRVIRLNQTKNGSARTVPLGRHAVEVVEGVLANPIRPIVIPSCFFGETRVTMATGDPTNTIPLGDAR